MTQTTDRMETVLDKLEGNNEEFRFFLHHIIKSAVRMVNRTEELQEEIEGFERITQINISDVDIHFWFEYNNSRVIYKKGFNKNASLEITVTKDLIIRIIKQEIRGGDAYMKGKIKVRGDFSHAIRAKYILRSVLKYLNQLNKQQ